MAKSYYERLPPVPSREDTDLSHLDDAMADILYPGARPRPFRIALEFHDFEGEGADEARKLARSGSLYREVRDARGGLRHHAGFDRSGANLQRRLFEIVGHRPGTDVFVDGRFTPYAREVWMPLFWLFGVKGSEAEA